MHKEDKATEVITSHRPMTQAPCIPHITWRPNCEALRDKKDSTSSSVGASRSSAMHGDHTHSSVMPPYRRNSTMHCHGWCGYHTPNVTTATTAVVTEDNPALLVSSTCRTNCFSFFSPLGLLLIARYIWVLPITLPTRQHCAASRPPRPLG